MESKQTPQSSNPSTATALPLAPPLSRLNSQGQLVVDLTVPASELVIGDKLGQGAFGVVYKGQWRKKPVAIKQLVIANPSEQDKTEFKQEAAVMFQIGADSEHVVRLYKITIQPHFSLVMELMPKGNLFDLLRLNRDTPLLWEVRYRLAMDISTGLEDIHSHGVLHRDLKSLNVLLDDRLRAKLTDFGLAGIRNASSRHSSAKGTPHWMAPEVVNGDPATESSDVYSLGMVLWELVTHRQPYAHLTNPLQVMFQVAQGKQEVIPDDCPANFKQLILDCWSMASKRPKAADITTRLQPLLESKAEPATTLLASLSLSSGPRYQEAAPLSPAQGLKEQKVDVQPPVSLASVSLASNPHYQPEAPAKPKVQEEKAAGLEAFQKGEQLYWQGQYQPALPYLQQVAREQYPSAYLYLGCMYEYGQGVVKDPGESAIWYDKAQSKEAWFIQQATKGDATAQRHLGAYYQFAAGAKKDLVQAVTWYRRAAEQGDAWAQVNLAFCYDRGDGVPQDPLQAVSWFRKAAEQGHAIAQYNLGWCYENGRGIAKDLLLAKQWYEKAASQGNGLAQTNLRNLLQANPSLDRNPHKPDNKVEAKQVMHNPPPVTPHAMPQKSAAPAVVDEKALGQLLKFVAEGEQDQAETLIKKDLKLLLAAGKVTDLSGRTFDNITTFQYALWAVDYHMWSMIQKYLPIEAQAKQHALLESKGTVHGKHFDLQPLLDALKTYVDNAHKWNYGQRAVDQWCKKVGGAQKLLPAHVVNEYCRPDRRFYPYPTEWTSKLPRNRAVEDVWNGSKYVKGGSWFSAPQLGVSFAFYRQYERWARAGGWKWVDAGCSGASEDLTSLQALWHARTEQLKLLTITLGEVQPLASFAGVSRASNPQHQPEAPAKPTVQEEKVAGFEAFLKGRQFYGLGQFLKALPYFWEAASHHYPPAYLYLGDTYGFGQGVEKNEEESAIWYGKAQTQETWFLEQAAKGDAISQSNLGCYYLFAAGAKKDFREAVSWCRRAAEQGDAEAQYNLGYCYSGGIGVAQDYGQAVNWYRRAAEQGVAFAQYALGECYQSGNGEVQDHSQAVSWFRKAAQQGLTYAQVALGDCYYSGQGVIQDFTQAVSWYRRAAEQGHARAQSNLGACYFNGWGVGQDHGQAVSWYRCAAEQGHAGAQFNLGVHYEKGQGVAKDLRLAKEWYEIAVSQGSELAKTNLRDLLQANPSLATNPSGFFASSNSTRADAKPEAKQAASSQPKTAPKSFLDGIFRKK